MTILPNEEKKDLIVTVCCFPDQTFSLPIQQLSKKSEFFNLVCENLPDDHTIHLETFGNFDKLHPSLHTVAKHATSTMLSYLSGSFDKQQYIQSICLQPDSIICALFQCSYLMIHDHSIPRELRDRQIKRREKLGE